MNAIEVIRIIIYFIQIVWITVKQQQKTKVKNHFSTFDL
jgi:hypothetical protein